MKQPYEKYAEDAKRIKELEASDALRRTLIRDVLHRFELNEEEYYSSGGFSLLEVIDQMRSDNASLRAENAELRKGFPEADQLLELLAETARWKEAYENLRQNQERSNRGLNA